MKVDDLRSDAKNIANKGFDRLYNFQRFGKYVESAAMSKIDDVPNKFTREVPLDLLVFQSFFLSILLMKFLLIINSLVESNGDEYPARIQSEDVALLKVLYYLFHVCFCSSIGLVAFSSIRSDLLIY